MPNGVDMIGFGFQRAFIYSMRKIYLTFADKSRKADSTDEGFFVRMR